MVWTGSRKKTFRTQFKHETDQPQHTYTQTNRRSIGLKHVTLKKEVTLGKVDQSVILTSLASSWDLRSQSSSISESTFGRMVKSTYSPNYKKSHGTWEWSSLSWRIESRKEKVRSESLDLGELADIYNKTYFMFYFLEHEEKKMK